MTPARLAALTRLVGPAGWQQHGEADQRRVTVSPADTAQCAALLRWCHETRTPLALADAAKTHGDLAPELLLRTDRLRHVRRVSASGRRLVAEVGAPMSALAAAAAEVGLRLPTGLEATDSRSLGEALQSAARGHAVLGLEVVLPDGRVWQDATEVLGSATHRALGHLFFAAGGALGVVTAVALRLQAAQAGRGDDHDDVPELAWAPDCAGPRLEAQALDAELLARIKRAFDPNHLLNPGQRL